MTRKNCRLVSKFARGPGVLVGAAVVLACFAVIVTLTIRASMKPRSHFSEPRNQAVFTTKGLLRSNLPILRVFHDENGDWQFFGDEEATDNNCSVVGLGAVVQYDPSVTEVAWLPTGWCAARDSKDDRWWTGKQR